MGESQDQKRYAPATERNREPIGEVLSRFLPQTGFVLEIASGTGEHAVFFAEKFPHLTFQPTDPDPDALQSIASWREEKNFPNVLSPIFLDASREPWPISSANAIININMIHISPWEASIGLFRGASALLPVGGLLYMYGPFKINNTHTAPSNEQFDLHLQSRNPLWGVRDLGTVQELAKQYGITLEEKISMPANNFSLIFRKVK